MIIGTAVVTGCLGFIGFHMTKRLLSMGWRVYGVDKMTYVSNENHLDRFEEILFDSRSPLTNFKFVQQDICELDRIPQCDVVINYAAESHVANSIISSESFLKSNLIGVHNLLELIKKMPYNVKPLYLQISTDEIYGDIASGSFSEESCLNPSNPYAASKAAADMLIQSYGRTHDLQYNIVRLTNCYGVYQYPEKLIPLSVKHLLSNEKICLHNEGTPIRTWLNVEDSVSAVLSVLYDGEKNQVYNVSGGYEQTNFETVEKIIRTFFNSQNTEIDIDKYIDYSYSRQGQDIRYSLDDSKIRRIGWKPEKNFDEEIRRVVSFYKRLENVRW